MRIERWERYLSCVEELLEAPQVQAMRDIAHHPGVSCFEHSLFVSYVAFRLATGWRGDGRGCSTICISTTPGACPPTSSALPTPGRPHAMPGTCAAG